MHTNILSTTTFQPTQPTPTQFTVGPQAHTSDPNPTAAASLHVGLGIRGLDHLGIAVENIAAARALYETALGAKFTGEEVVAEQKVRVAFFELGDAANPTRIELLEPLDVESPIAKFLAKRGPGLHHMAYRVDDVGRALHAAAEAGLRLIDRAPRRGAHGALIGFLHPQSTGGMLTELCSPATHHEPQSAAVNASSA